MTTIILDVGVDHAYAPGDSVTGRILVNKQIDVSAVDLHLTGKIRIAQADSQTAPPTVEEITFVSILLPIFKEKALVRTGHEWPFSLRIPTEVDWHAVKGYYDAVYPATLGKTEASALPKQLPPSLGKFEVGSASIIYELKVIRSGAERTASKPVEINVTSPRSDEQPTVHSKIHVERFQPQSHVFDSPEDQSRHITGKLKDAFRSKKPSSYKFDIHFSIPQQVVAGNRMRVSLVRKGDAQTSSGMPAPHLFLEEFRVSVQSQTHIDCRKYSNADRNEKSDRHDSVRSVEVQTTRIHEPIALQQDQELDMRDHAKRMGVWAGEIPSFHTYGISRGFVTEISGLISFGSHYSQRMRFSLGKKPLTVYSAEYRPSPGSASAPGSPKQAANDAQRRPLSTIATIKGASTTVGSPRSPQISGQIAPTLTSATSGNSELPTSLSSPKQSLERVRRRPVSTSGSAAATSSGQHHHHHSLPYTVPPPVRYSSEAPSLAGSAAEKGT